MNELTHIDAQGQASMVDVTDKPASVRIAEAEAYVYMSAATLEQIIAQSNKKGDVIATARIAGIMAAKRCAELIPLCHPLALSKVDVDFALETEQGRIRVTSRCKLTGNTGVEMEALTAVSVAALTLFDMCKAVDPAMQIEGMRVLTKQGGKSGNWQNPNTSKLEA